MKLPAFLKKIGNYLPGFTMPKIEINALEAMGATAAGFLLARLSQQLRHNTATTNQEVFLSLAAMGTLVSYKFAVSAGRALRRNPTNAATVVVAPTLSAKEVVSKQPETTTKASSKDKKALKSTALAKKVTQKKDNTSTGAEIEQGGRKKKMPASAVKATTKTKTANQDKDKETLKNSNTATEQEGTTIQKPKKKKRHSL
ncbi:MAG: hypothetical protein BGO43_00010 [Gammaproteobacteria bacterium 39-13]|nr:hypothetical protein [Gammaproteobacteria bacterium]OJV96651.1 MAG: hypothetical protein BGO43_00010 [Gammaproteobacteria bacterium 39-13]